MFWSRNILFFQTAYSKHKSNETIMRDCRSGEECGSGDREQVSRESWSLQLEKEGTRRTLTEGKENTPASQFLPSFSSSPFLPSFIALFKQMEENQLLAPKMKRLCHHFIFKFSRFLFVIYFKYMCNFWGKMMLSCKSLWVALMSGYRVREAWFECRLRHLPAECALECPLATLDFSFVTYSMSSWHLACKHLMRWCV